MTVQAVDTKPGDSYPPRGDRLQEEPSAKNAQGLFPPDACIFVGNLSTKFPAEQLAEDLKKVFLQFGPCHVKIKQDKKKNLPGAFVQFEHVEDANAALGWNQCTILHDRWLRIERAKGRRTACLGLHSGAPITETDLTAALGGRGHIEAYRIEAGFSPFNTRTNICKVTFAYVDDCRDAIRHYSKSDTYWMHLLDMDGSPLVLDSGNGSPQTQPHNAPHPVRNGSSQSRYHNHRPHRNGPPHHRGGYRGVPRYRHPQYHQERFPLRGGYPSPPDVGNGMPYENHPHFYPPPPPPPPPHPPPPPPPPMLPPPGLPGNDYGGYPYIVHSQPGYSHPPPPPPPMAHAPHVNNGPLIVNSQPMYSGPAPGYYGEFYFPDNGYYSPQSSMTSQSSGYFGPTSQMCYNGPYPQNPDYLTPPSSINKATPPLQTDSTVQEDPGADKGSETVKEQTESDKEPEVNKTPEPQNEPQPGPESEETDIFNLTNPEKPPRLIRIHDSDSESDSEEEEIVSKTKPKPTTQPLRSLDPVREETEDETTTLEPGSESDSPASTSDNSSATRKPDRTTTQSKLQYTSNPNTNPDPKSNSNSPSPSPSLRSVSRVRKPLEAKYQPTTGVTVEEYVRRELERRQPNWLGEEQALDVIVELEEERKQKCMWAVFESGSSSRSGSLARSCSSKSV